MKIYWAIDPFAGKDILKKGAELIQWIQSPNDQVHAIYAATPMEPHLVTSHDVPDKQKFSSYPESIIKTVLKKNRVTYKDAVVLNIQNFSLTSVGKTLSDYLKQHKVDLVTCATHNRKGFERFMLGSFAETLIHVSQTDILAYSLDAKLKSRSPGNIIYAHDFTRKGDAGLKKVLHYAKLWNSSVTIYHQPEPSFQIEFGAQEKKAESERKKVERKIQAIKNLLKKEDIPGSVEIKLTWLQVSEGVLRLAKKEKSDIVAIAAQSGKLMAAMGGSITRQTLRKSKIPVLILKV